MGDNAINAAIAHQMRSGDDNTFVRSIVQSYTFATYGKVISYSGGRVDVQCGSLKFTNVEVLVLGVNGWGIKPVPAVGDRVLLISSQAPVIDIKQFRATGTMPPYDVSGLKAIPVTDEKAATQLITVDKSKIDITGDNKLTVNADGVKFEDKNGNKVTTSSDGVAFKDKNGNKITTDSNGVAFEDKNSNKVTTDSNGIATEDKNGNKYTGTSTGTVIEATGGCKIEMGASSVKINGKLEILKN